MIVKYNFFEYEIFFYNEFKNIDFEIKKNVLEILHQVNIESNVKLTYGLFDPRLSLESKVGLLNNMNVAIMKLNGSNVSFNYQYNFDCLIDNKKILHQGLIISTKNPGRNITLVNKINSDLVFRESGDFFTTSLAAAPFAFGEFSRFFQKSWPNPYGNQKKPENFNYINIAQMCFEKYVKEFFPYPESLEFDLKRFVVKSKAQEMGFEVDFRKMQRDHELLVNLFSMFWLDYSKQEIMLQVGVYNQECSRIINDIILDNNIEIIKIK